MGKTITAHTNPGFNPGFVNFTRNDDGTVTLNARGDPTTLDGIYICGFRADKGSPGRCTPGDENCNNYCNMAPDKGPMQDCAKPFVHTHNGETIGMTMTAEAFDALIAGAK